MAFRPASSPAFAPPRGLRAAAKPPWPTLRADVVLRREPAGERGDGAADVDERPARTAAGDLSAGDATGAIAGVATASSGFFTAGARVGVAGGSASAGLACGAWASSAVTPPGTNPDAPDSELASGASAAGAFEGDVRSALAEDITAARARGDASRRLEDGDVGLDGTGKGGGGGAGWDGGCVCAFAC